MIFRMIFRMIFWAAFGAGCVVYGQLPGFNSLSIVAGFAAGCVAGMIDSWIWGKKKE